MAQSRVSVKVALQVLALLVVVMAVGTYFLASKQSKSLEDQLLKRGKIEAIIGAKAYGRVIEEAVDNGVFTIKDAFDTNYEAIGDFDPPKYHTKYDSYLDKSILSLEDEILLDDSVVYAVGVDLNGYLPTHNTRYQKPITGDKEVDKVGNRTKRIFNDPVGAKAAANTEQGFLQIYHRDTGETMWDISAPIYVKGKHWGGFRIGFSLKKTEDAQQALVITLVGIMLLILVVSALGIIVSVNRSLKPLGEFSHIASELADGNVQTPIVMKSDDEIGQLADALERLRVSLKAAMDRLKR